MANHKEPWVVPCRTCQGRRKVLHDEKSGGYPCWVCSGTGNEPETQLDRIEKRLIEIEFLLREEHHAGR